MVMVAGAAPPAQQSGGSGMFSGLGGMMAQGVHFSSTDRHIAQFYAAKKPAQSGTHISPPVKQSWNGCAPLMSRVVGKFASCGSNDMHCRNGYGHG